MASVWQMFQPAIEEAKIACENSGQAVADHFNLQVKMIKTGKGAKAGEYFRSMRLWK